MTRTSTSNLQIGSNSPKIDLDAYKERDRYSGHEEKTDTSSEACIPEPSFFLAYCTPSTPCNINIQVDFKKVRRQRMISALNKKFK
jgi:hypothetical protein